MVRAAPPRGPQSNFNILAGRPAQGRDHPQPQPAHNKVEVNGDRSCVPRHIAAPGAAPSLSHQHPCSDSDARSITSNTVASGLASSRLHNASQDDVNYSDRHSPKHPPGRQRGSRPAITEHTFTALEPVHELGAQTAFNPAAQPTPATTAPQLPQPDPRGKNPRQDCLAKHLATRSLSEAVHSIPSAETQLAKHRSGHFEWVLAITYPPSSHNPGPSVSRLPRLTNETRKVLFGCNLYPQTDLNHRGTDCTSYRLLATPLRSGVRLVKADSERPTQATMSSTQTCEPLVATNQSRQSLVVTPPERHGDQQTVGPADHNRSPNLATTGNLQQQQKPIGTPARIEDSFEAIDKLEDQLEAFDGAAAFRTLASSDATHGVRDQSRTTESPQTTTPLAKRGSILKDGSASARVKSNTGPGPSSIRKSVSMVFDEPKAKLDEKPSSQTTLKRSSVGRPASHHPPKTPPKSTKPPTKASFELPGDAVARRLKEKREARLAAQEAAEKQTTAQATTLRRTKSARAPLRSNFELPGEAISRRKREEREAQLKAQEEEERKRREFKARPIRANIGAVNTLPRDTAASRARQQGKHLGAENMASSTLKRASTVHHPQGRPPLANTGNQQRGRVVADSPAHPHSPASYRATSHASSAGSMSGKRSSVSLEDVAHQRLRGHEIYIRDNSYRRDREGEKRERETLARLAREEAAERSRAKSREWAAKQARKRITISSLRDVM